MANVKMGFEGILYIGAAGSTASTQLLNVKDISINREVERGNTTVRGASTSPPIETQSVTLRKCEIEFVMINDITDTNLETIRSAAANGTGLAIRGKDYSSGKGPDMDATFSISEPWPLNGEQALTITATPSRDYGRSPSLYS